MNNKKLIGFVVFFGVVIIVAAIVIYFVLTSLPSWQERSQFGEMFGVLNAFFSGLAFLGLVYTILLQRQELAEQRLSVERTNRLNGLSALLTICSDDEEKYRDIDRERSSVARLRKEKVLAQIESEFIESLEMKDS